MDISVLIPLAMFAFVMSITPGPNNVMLAASGLNFGITASLQHIFGILFGLSLQLLVTGAGLGGVFHTAPRVQLALKIVGTAYLLWLSLRLWRAGSGAGKTAVRPMNFPEAAAFQFVNPKAWLISVTACAAFLVPDRPVVLQSVIFGLVFLILGAPCMLIWASFGAGMSRMISDSEKLRLMNRAFAVLTALTGGMFWI